MTSQPTPRPLFTKDEADELLNLIKTAHAAAGDYARAMSFRISDEAVDKAQEADAAAVRAVQDWIISRADYGQTNQ